MIARPPPQTAPAHLKRDIAAGELGVQFLHVDIVAVGGGPDAKRMLVADEFGICAQGHRIGQLEPPTEVRLDLLAVRMVLPHAVFTESYAPLPNREGITLDLKPATNPNGPSWRPIRVRHGSQLD